jgi:hypothetical protein
MLSRTWGLFLVLLLGMIPGCNDTLNPLRGSSRPVPVIGSLSPSTVTFAQVQQGFTLTVNGNQGNQFVSSTVVLVNGKLRAASSSD